MGPFSGLGPGWGVPSWSGGYGEGWPSVDPAALRTAEAGEGSGPRPQGEPRLAEETLESILASSEARGGRQALLGGQPKRPGSPECKRVRNQATFARLGTHQTTLAETEMKNASDPKSWPSNFSIRSKVVCLFHTQYSYRVLSTRRKHRRRLKQPLNGTGAHAASAPAPASRIEYRSPAVTPRVQYLTAAHSPAPRFGLSRSDIRLRVGRLWASGA